MANDPTAPSSEVHHPEPSVEEGLPAEAMHFINLVRAKMRDYPELNRLIAGQETSDRMIALAIMEAIDWFNTTPPLLGNNYKLSTFPSKSLLLRGTIICILESIGILQTRNHLVYSDGQGIQVGVSDKAPELMRWLGLFTSQYEKKVTDLKKAINLDGALNGSGVHSEYTVVNGYWDYLT